MSLLLWQVLSLYLLCMFYAVYRIADANIARRHHALRFANHVIKVQHQMIRDMMPA